MNRSKVFRFVILTVPVVLAVSCATAKFEVSEDMGEAEYFQRAQEAADLSNWDVALAYYKASLEKFPNDLEYALAAEYEIAFIYKKKGNIAEAEAGFKALLEKYKAGFDTPVPEWPKVLAEKMLQELSGAPAAESDDSESTTPETQPDITPAQ